MRPCHEGPLWPKQHKACRWAHGLWVDFLAPVAKSSVDLWKARTFQWRQLERRRCAQAVFGGGGGGFHIAITNAALSRPCRSIRKMHKLTPATCCGEGSGSARSRRRTCRCVSHAIVAMPMYLAFGSTKSRVLVRVAKARTTDDVLLESPPAARCVYAEPDKHHTMLARCLLPRPPRNGV